MLLIIKSLYLNGDEVRELLHEKELLAFLEASSNEAWTIPKEIRVSREELISIFKNLNNLLRSEGLRSEFANILFLKLLSENNEKSWWNNIKAQSNDVILSVTLIAML
ncbi:restriction endonuclease subunit M [Rickettsia conorii]